MNIDHVLVAIPARNEADVLASCLKAVRQACEQLQRERPVTVQTVVALDHCTDSSETIARRAGVTCVIPIRRGVGAARRAAVLAGLAVGTDTARVWIANTDADTRAPQHWLARQIALADAGHDLVLGTVEPEGLPAPLMASWSARHDLAEGHSHVHGANLGIRGSTYEEIGGFANLRLHEDADLVSRARSRGARVIATDVVRVRTSGRRRGRAVGGFADYLAALDT